MPRNPLQLVSPAVAPASNPCTRAPRTPRIPSSLHPRAQLSLVSFFPSFPPRDAVHKIFVFQAPAGIREAR